MSQKVIYLLLAVSLGVNIGVIATTLLQRPDALPPGPGPRPGPGQRPGPERLVEDHVQGMTRHLNLDASQQQAIRLVMQSHAPDLIRLRSAADSAGQKLSAAFAQPAFAPEQFRRLTAAAAVARSRVDSLSAVMLMSEAAILTPEQRQKYAQVAPSIHSGPQGPPGEGRPPRDGGLPPEGGQPRDGGPPPR